MTTPPTPEILGNDDHPAPGPSGGPTDPSPTAELSALAAQLCRLADRVNRLDARANQLRETISVDVLSQLAELRASTADHLAAQTAQVQQLIATVTEHSNGPLDWATMDASHAVTEWDSLARWIEHTLVPWYELTRDQLPDCWALHRPAVIELAWLHQTHHATHQPGATPHLVAEWHTRWKPAALHTVRDAIPRRGTRTCGPGHHLTSEADRIRRHPSELPAGVPIKPGAAPTAQPAERRHWQPFYEQAVTADLVTRRERSGAAIAESIGDDWAGHPATAQLQRCREEDHLNE